METLEMNVALHHDIQGPLEKAMDVMDQEILRETIANRFLELASTRKPLVGDFVIWPTGETRRISDDLETSVRTTPADAGKFLVNRRGRAVTDGHHYPPQMVEFFVMTPKLTTGSFWFHSHNDTRDGRQVKCKLPCRIFSFVPFRRTLEEAAVHPRAIRCRASWGSDDSKYLEVIESIMNPKVINDPTNG